MTTGESKLKKAAELTLRCLELVAKGVVFLKEHPHRQAVILNKGWEGLRRYKQRRDVKERLQERLRYLRKKQCIKIQKEKNRLRCILTDRGLLRLLQRRMQTAKKLPHGRIIVIFDIPEDYRAARNMFRRFLKLHGFSMLQQSVWIIDRDVHEPLCEFIRIKKLERWLNVLKAEVAFEFGRGVPRAMFE